VANGKVARTLPHASGRKRLGAENLSRRRFAGDDECVLGHSEAGREHRVTRRDDWPRQLRKISFGLVHYMLTFARLGSRPTLRGHPVTPNPLAQKSEHGLPDLTSAFPPGRGPGGSCNGLVWLQQTLSARRPHLRQS